MKLGVSVIPIREYIVSSYDVWNGDRHVLGSHKKHSRTKLGPCRSAEGARGKNLNEEKYQ